MNNFTKNLILTGLGLSFAYGLANKVYADEGKGHLHVGKLELKIVEPKDTPTPEEYKDPSNTGIPLVYVSEDQLDKKVTDNFTIGEYARIHGKISKKTPVYKHNGGVYHEYMRIDPELVEGVQQLREKVGVPLKINSGYRSKSQNELAGGAPYSRHSAGQAADVSGANLNEMYKIADGMFGGLGFYPKLGFIHVDTRDGKKARWKGN